MARRVTISDIAVAIGVSKSAVSYALNNQPGVGAEMRARIVDQAREMGWYPSSSARILNGAGTGAIGIVLARSPETLSIEPYFMKMIAGIESVLLEENLSLMLRLIGSDISAELDTYQRWWGERRIDGVILLDERYHDERLDLVERLGLPAVLHGGPHTRPGLACIWTDEAADATMVLDYLVGEGHMQIGHIGGPRTLVHERRRRRALRSASESVGARLVDSIEADYIGTSAVEASLRLLDRSDAPTAIIYGSDVMAVSALSALAEKGIRVPQDLSVVSWDDSLLCTLANPRVTALNRDVMSNGIRGARALLALIQGQQVANQRVIGHRLQVRQSSGPVPQD